MKGTPSRFLLNMQAWIHEDSYFQSFGQHTTASSTTCHSRCTETLHFLKQWKKNMRLNRAWGALHPNPTVIVSKSPSDIWGRTASEAVYVVTEMHCTNESKTMLSPYTCRFLQWQIMSQIVHSFVCSFVRLFVQKAVNESLVPQLLTICIVLTISSYTKQNAHLKNKPSWAAI